MDRVLKEHFDRFMSKGEMPPDLTLRGCKLFTDKEKLAEWRNNFKGIQYEEGGVLLRGAVDNILMKGKKLIVLDYKTRGYPVKEDTHVHYQLQMDVYNYLLRKNGYSTEDYAYLLFYYPKKVLSSGNVVFKKKLVKVEIDVKNAEKVFKEARRVLKMEEAPASSEECSFCKYLENNGV